MGNTVSYIYTVPYTVQGTLFPTGYRVQSLGAPAFQKQTRPTNKPHKQRGADSRPQSRTLTPTPYNLNPTLNPTT